MTSATGAGNRTMSQLISKNEMATFLRFAKDLEETFDGNE